MITPYEAVLAFVPNKEWTGEYNIGFGALLGLGSEESEEENGGGDQQQQEEEPTFSLIRGRRHRCQRDRPDRQLAAFQW